MLVPACFLAGTLVLSCWHPRTCAGTHVFLSTDEKGTRVLECRQPRFGAKLKLLITREPLPLHEGGMGGVSSQHPRKLQGQFPNPGKLQGQIPSPRKEPLNPNPEKVKYLNPDPEKFNCCTRGGNKISRFPITQIFFSPSPTKIYSYTASKLVFLPFCFH